MSDQTTSDPAIRDELNLKGEVCPYTFVRSKLALMKLASGEVLRVIVDYPPSADNVPRSLEEQGHRVLAVEKINASDWAIIVQKG